MKLPKAVSATWALALLAGSFNWLSAGDLPTREAVLSLLYPGAEWNAERLFLSSDQLAKIEAEAGTAYESPLVARYELQRAGVIIGRAYVDTHQVRTKKQSLLICLDAEGKVLRVETTAFLEPPEYQLSAQWLGQFRQIKDPGQARLGQGVRPSAGATLSAMATTQAVRRAMVLDRLLQSKSGEEASRR